MADNIPTTTNASVATDDIGNVHFQRMKLTLGADGVNDGDVSAVNPMPVEMVSGVGLTDAELRATPVDVAGTVSVDDSTPISVAVDGTVPVSVAAILDVEQQPPPCGGENRPGQRHRDLHWPGRPPARRPARRAGASSA